MKQLQKSPHANCFSSSLLLTSSKHSVSVHKDSKQVFLWINLPAENGQGNAQTFIWNPKTFTSKSSLQKSSLHLKQSKLCIFIGYLGKQKLTKLKLFFKQPDFYCTSLKNKNKVFLNPSFQNKTKKKQTSHTKKAQTKQKFLSFLFKPHIKLHLKRWKKTKTIAVSSFQPRYTRTSTSLGNAECRPKPYP